MKNRDGFSIIELLILILITVVLIVTCYPVASNIVTSMKTKTIEKATRKGFEKYKLEYSNFFQEDGCYDVDYNYLVDNKHMEPILDTTCKGHIHATKKGDDFEYEYYLSCHNSKYQIVDNYKDMDQTCKTFK